MGQDQRQVQSSCSSPAGGGLLYAAYGHHQQLPSQLLFAASPVIAAPATMLVAAFMPHAVASWQYSVES